MQRSVREIWQRWYRVVIYLALFGVILGAAFYRGRLTLNVSSMTRGLYDAVQDIPRRRAAKIARAEEALSAARSANAPTTEVQRLAAQLGRLQAHSNGVLMFSFDFAPDVAPELSPMAEAVLRHTFERDVHVVAMAAAQAIGAPMGQGILASVAQNGNGYYTERLPGRDYVFLGYRPGLFNVLMQMGKDIIATFETDYGGTPLEELPFMRAVRTYDDVDLVVSLTGYVSVPELWLQTAGTKYHAPLGMGMTAVSVAGYTPYVQSKQLVGLLAGLRGAAEYETAIGQPATATRRMMAQLYAHVLVIFFIALGNIEFLLRRWHGA